MGERVVADVVQHGGELDVLRVARVQAVAGLLELGESPAGKVIGAEHVLEAGVRGARIDEEGVPELPDVPQALHRGRVDDSQRLGLQADVIPQRVADDLELFQTWGPASPTAPGRRSTPYSRASTARRAARCARRAFRRRCGGQAGGTARRNTRRRSPWVR